MKYLSNMQYRYTYNNLRVKYIRNLLSDMFKNYEHIRRSNWEDVFDDIDKDDDYEFIMCTAHRILNVTDVLQFKNIWYHWFNADDALMELELIFLEQNNMNDRIDPVMCHFINQAKKDGLYKCAETTISNCSTYPYNITQWIENQYNKV